MQQTTPKTCPKCGKSYVGYPALSRVDNRTKICPECGLREALDAFGMNAAEQDRLLMSIREKTPESVQQETARALLEGKIWNKMT